MAAPFTEAQIQRYSRHILLPEIGGKGQRRLGRSSVAVVGAGGLGSPAAFYLAAAGVGRIGIIDGDRVDLSNLQRQILHQTQDVGRNKAESAAEKLRALNPDIEVAAYDQSLTAADAMEILSGYDLVVDATDRFPARYLLNDACRFLGIPLVYGAISRFEGQATVFLPDQGPCYRCLFPSPPPPGGVLSCAEAGVIGVLPAVIGSIQATEAVKYLLGKGRLLAGRLLLYDALAMRFEEIACDRDPACALCGSAPVIKELMDYEAFCGEGGGGIGTG